MQLRRSLSDGLSNLLPAEPKGGEGIELLLRERAKPGWLGCRNSYWVLTLFGFRAVPILPLFVFLCYTLLVVLLGPREGGGTMLSSLKDLLSMVGILLSLLLSFRNQGAFARWQAGSDSFNALCTEAKQFACSITGWLGLFCSEGPDGHEVVQERLRWLLAFVELSKQALRNENDLGVLSSVLRPAELEGLVATEDRVVHALYHLGNIEFKYTARIVPAFYPMPSALYMRYGECKRVNCTPLPFAYVAHLRTFMVCWLAIIPWAYLQEYGWWTLLLCAVIGYGIIGVEEVAVEVEHPFGRDFNDIPMESLTLEVGTTVEELMRAVQRSKAGGTTAAAMGPPSQQQGQAGMRVMVGP